MTGNRIKALKLATARKKKEALEKTEKAIQTLIKKNRKITIRSVSREADVSTSYIYKHPELAYRIQTLREQQKYNHVKPETPSSKSHQIIATQLRNRIKIIEQEKEELIKEIKVLAANVYEMSKGENFVERLKAENIKLLTENKELRKQLKHFENEITKQRDFIFKQGYKNKYDDAGHYQKEPKTLRLIPGNDNLGLAILPGQSITQVNVIDDEIQKLLSEAEIKLSKTMVRLIKSKPREQVINAINVVLKNMNTGVKIRSKVGLLRSALNEEWIPNESPEQRMLEQQKEEFSEWFDLAKDQGVVQASQLTSEGIIVLRPGGKWILYKSMLEDGWSLHYLKGKSKTN